MQFTLHAARRTPHGASRLMQAMSAWLVKTRRAPCRHNRDARVYVHTTTTMHKLSTHLAPHPPSPLQPTGIDSSYSLNPPSPSARKPKSNRRRLQDDGSGNITRSATSPPPPPQPTAGMAPRVATAAEAWPDDDESAPLMWADVVSVGIRFMGFPVVRILFFCKGWLWGRRKKVENDLNYTWYWYRWRLRRRHGPLVMTWRR